MTQFKKINKNPIPIPKNKLLDFLSEAIFNEEYYLNSYPDVKQAVEHGLFNSGYHHFLLCGYKECRSFIPGFNEIYYQQHNPDVKEGIKNGVFKCGLEHYLKYGIKENRIKDTQVSNNLIISSIRNQNIILKLYINY